MPVGLIVILFISFISIVCAASCNITKERLTIAKGFQKFYFNASRDIEYLRTAQHIEDLIRNSTISAGNIIPESINYTAFTMIFIEVLPYEWANRDILEVVGTNITIIQTALAKAFESIILPFYNNAKKALTANSKADLNAQKCAISAAMSPFFVQKYATQVNKLFQDALGSDVRVLYVTKMSTFLPFLLISTGNKTAISTTSKPR